MSSLRSLLGDGATDKYEFKTTASPAPDGLTTRFFTGRPRLVAGTLAVHLAGVAVPTSGYTENATDGTFDMVTAPSAEIALEASFYYQWFTDAELQEFITQSAQSVGFTGIDDTSLVVGIRAIVLDFAAYYAYMRKAAEYAESLVASAAGYTADQSKSGPNWRALAQTAWDTAEKRMKVYADNPLAGGTKPGMRFVHFHLPSYVPPS